jgi:hypothetical protein
VSLKEAEWEDVMHQDVWDRRMFSTEFRCKTWFEDLGIDGMIILK